MLLISSILPWQPFFIILLLRKMVNKSPRIIRLTKTNNRVLRFNFILMTLMPLWAISFSVEEYTVYYFLLLTGLYFATILLFSDFMIQAKDDYVILQTSIILYVFAILALLELLFELGIFANTAPANDRKNEFFLGFISFYSERIIVGASGAAGYTIFLLIFAIVSCATKHRKIHWTNIFVIILLVYFSGSRTAMIVVPSAIAYMIILQINSRIRWLVLLMAALVLSYFIFPYLSKAFAIGNTLAQRFNLYEVVMGQLNYEISLNGLGTSNITGKPVHNPLLAGYLLGGVACSFSVLILFLSSINSCGKLQIKLLPIYATGMVIWLLSPFILFLPFIYLMRVTSIVR